MDIKEFEAIKGKLETLKAKKAKADGAMESIMARFKEMELNTLEDAEAYLLALEKKVAEDEAILETLMTELKGLYSWQFV